MATDVALPQASGDLLFLLPLEEWSGIQFPLAHNMPGCLLGSTNSVQPSDHPTHNIPLGVDQLCEVEGELVCAAVAAVPFSCVKDAAFSPPS